jgi:chromosome segregation ATPase
MSSKIDILPDTSLLSLKQEPLTVREKIVSIFQELEDTRDEQRRVNSELDKEIQARIEAESEATHLRRQVQSIEVKLDSSTIRVNHLTTQLIEVVKVSEAARQYAYHFYKKEKKQHFFFSVCTNLENKLTTVKDREIDLDDQLHKAKECSIETDKRFQEVNILFFRYKLFILFK